MEIYSKIIKIFFRKGYHHIWRSMALKSLISGIDNKISNQMYHQMMLQHIFILLSDISSLSFYFWVLHLLRNCSYVGESLPEDHKHTAGAAAQAEVAQVKGVSPAPRTITVPRSSGSTERQPHIPETQERGGGETRKSEKEEKKHEFLPIEQFSLNGSADACSQSAVKLNLGASQHVTINYSASTRALFTSYFCLCFFYDFIFFRKCPYISNFILHNLSWYAFIFRCNKGGLHL